MQRVTKTISYCNLFLYFCPTSFQFTFSLQFTIVFCSLSGPKTCLIEVNAIFLHTLIMHYILNYSPVWTDIGPDHEQMTKVNWKLKVNWKNLQKHFCKFFQFTLLIVNHVLWVKSIAANESQLELKKVKWILCSNWLSLFANEFTQAHDSHK